VRPGRVGLGERLRAGLDMLEWRELRLRGGRCPLCGPTIFVKLQRDQLGVRCLRCASCPIHMALATVVLRRVPPLATLRVYEASSQGPWVDFLARQAGELVCSEFFAAVPPGHDLEGVRCEDLQALSFPDACFDLCTHTEVLEHVPDDARALRELQRVLRPGGWLIFTVPLFDRDTTALRATRVAGELVHHLPAQYHGDRIRGAGRVLVFRDYGRDVTERVLAAGFASARIEDGGDPTGLGYPAPVVVARKAGPD
jgi:SAM-dependent methyltransferase